MYQYIPPVHNPVFPVYDSLHDVVAEAIYALDDGVLTTNHLRQLFGSYHNTLLKLVAPQPPR
jgi:hypothetical protein